MEEREIIADMISPVKGNSDDSLLNFPLARWISKSVLKRIRTNSVEVIKKDSIMLNLLKSINNNSDVKINELSQEIKNLNKSRPNKL